MSELEAQLFAKAAQTFLNVPFRLHGRNPETGLDCVGLVAASLEAIGRPFDAPRGYGLRNTTIEKWIEHAASSGFEPVDGPIRAGHLLLCSPGPAQHHLMIATGAKTVIHAHAGLRRIVRQRLGRDVRILRQWRLQTSQ